MLKLRRSGRARSRRSLDGSGDGSIRRGWRDRILGTFRNGTVGRRDHFEFLFICPESSLKVGSAGAQVPTSRYSHHAHMHRDEVHSMVATTPISHMMANCTRTSTQRACSPTTDPQRSYQTSCSAHARAAGVRAARHIPWDLPSLLDPPWAHGGETKGAHAARSQTFGPFRDDGDGDSTISRL